MGVAVVELHLSLCIGHAREDHLPVPEGIFHEHLHGHPGQGSSGAPHQQDCPFRAVVAVLPVDLYHGVGVGVLAQVGRGHEHVPRLVGLPLGRLDKGHVAHPGGPELAVVLCQLDPYHVLVRVAPV